jgi:hypothetical protein
MHELVSFHALPMWNTYISNSSPITKLSAARSTAASLMQECEFAQQGWALACCCPSCKHLL